MDIRLTPDQEQIAALPLTGKTFLHGTAMTGKTTAGAARLWQLIAEGVPPESIMVLTPQRTLAEPYYRILENPGLPAGGQVNIMTLGGLSQRLINLFWPIFAADSGFGQPAKFPAFLTLESAQYYLAAIVDPLMAEGYFESVSIDRNRILSQIIDNLNKSAVTGIPLDQISTRLKAAWVGDPAHTIVYDQAQDCAVKFRNYCLENNLLDFSLQIEIFNRLLRPSLLVRSYFLSRIRHLIFDNIEEDTSIAHETIAGWLPDLDSALLIFDDDGGYRAFLGADPQSGIALETLCDLSIELTGNLVSSEPLNLLSTSLVKSINREAANNIPSDEILPAFSIQNFRYYPEMIDAVAGKIAGLVENGVAPGEIAVLSPFLSDSLRFSLSNRLERLNIPVRSHRPSRSLREEPAVQCLLSWAKLAHPNWGFFLSKSDFRSALHQSIENLDLMRADLLANITYRENNPAAGLTSFDLIRPDMQERITHTHGASFEKIRAWLENYKNGHVMELDVFLSRIFGELLSQPGFGFHNQFSYAASAALLIESTQKFRRDTGSMIIEDNSLGKAYIKLVEEGLVAAQYLQSWQEQPEDAVWLSPAYTFLMANRPTTYQIWLDTGSIGWWERLLQPITHPYVLSRYWPESSPWTDTYEFSTNQASMARLVQGLLRRCQEHVFMVTTTYNEQGNEQKGPLLQAIQVLLRRSKENKA